MVKLVVDEFTVGEGAHVHDLVPVPAGVYASSRASRVTEAERVAAGGVPSRPTRGGDGHTGWEVTPGDEACMAALLRYGMATWKQCGHWFYPGPARREFSGESRSAQRRLSQLQQVGWVRAEYGETWFGNVLWATPAGASIMRERVRVPVPAGGYSGNRMLHRLAVTDLGLRMEARNAVTITEREIRAVEAQHGYRPGDTDEHGYPYEDNQDAAEQLLAGCGVIGARSVKDGKGITRWLAPPIGADGVIHWPDLVHVRRTPTDQGVVGTLEAIEVELTPKPAHRLRQLLLGYRDSGLFDQVIYYATAEVTAQLVGWPDKRGWRDGVLQQIGAYPSGVSPVRAREDPNFRCMFDVRPVAAQDEGVQYRLDMKQVPETWWVSKAQWRSLRREWDAFNTDQGTRIPFLGWWTDLNGKRPTTLTATRRTR